MLELKSAYPAPEWAYDSRAVLRYWFALFSALVLLRFLFNANLLDKVVNYSADGGFIVAKIYPTTYGVLAVLIATLLSTRIELGKAKSPGAAQPDDVRGRHGRRCDLCRADGPQRLYRLSR